MIYDSQGHIAQYSSRDDVGGTPGPGDAVAQFVSQASEAQVQRLARAGLAGLGQERYQLPTDIAREIRDIARTPPAPIPLADVAPPAPDIAPPVLTGDETIFLTAPPAGTAPPAYSPMAEWISQNWPLLAIGGVAVVAMARRR